MGKERWIARGGIRFFKKVYSEDEGGGEEKFFYRAPTSDEIAAVAGGIETFPQTEAGAVSRNRRMGQFIAQFMCNEDGSALFTEEEVARIPPSLKLELVRLIVAGAVETGDAGKD